MVLTQATKQDRALVRKLYLTAFPREERAPFWLIKRRADQKRGEMLVAKEGEEFLGFAYTVCHAQYVYLFYFAVDAQKRGNGVGSGILRLLKQRYAGKRLFLAREVLDENAENYEQRSRRHRFYLRNGFADLPGHIREAGVVYDVMGVGGELSAEAYGKLITFWAGRTLRKLFKMEMTE